MSLILHCGAKPINYNELRSVPVPDRNHRWVGKQGKTYEIKRSEQWAGLQHADFAEALEVGCHRLGMPVDLERSKWGVSDDGSDLFGLVKFKEEVDGKPSTVAPYFTDDVVPSMGIRHSNVPNIERIVVDNVRVGLVDYILGLPRLTDMVEGLKASCLTDQHVSQLYLEAGRTKLLPWSHLGMVDDYWQKPTHDVFTKGGYTGWRMYNAINTVAKKYNPNRQMDIVRKSEQLIQDNSNTINF